MTQALPSEEGFQWRLMGGETAIFTVIAKNYLPSARVLMRSLAEQHPDWRRFVILVDRIDGYFDPQAEEFGLILSSELPIPKSSWFHFKYTVLELSTAVKPYAFQYLFDTYGFDRIVFLDPDIKLFSPMRRVTDAHSSANIILTPHLTAALDDNRRPTEIDILRSGVYNLGFIAVARTGESAAFLEWWQQRLYDHCVVDLARGIFVDQRWVDLVPGMFQGVEIVRDPGYNVAYWNLSHRKVTGTEPDYQVSGAPLCFFHFSGYDPDQPDQLSRHQNRHRIGSLPRATEEIVRSYHDELLSAGFLTCRKWPNAYGSFQNGTRIPDLGRAIHHEAPELLEHIADPFSEQGFRAFLNVWNSPVEDGTATRPSISRLAYRIYRTRTDVQSAMPDIFGANYKRFLEWMLVSGKAEHGLGDVFLTTVADAIQCVKNFQGTSEAPVLAAENAFTDKPIGLDPIGVNGTSRLRLTRLAVAIYESRAELQRYFPDPCGRDSARFLVWLLTYGKKEHHLSPLHLAPMKAQWRTVVNMQPTMASRLRYEATLRAFAASVVVRAAWARLGPLGKGLSRTQPKGSGEANPARNSAPRSLEFGVNLVGYFQSETGVGQSVRAAYGALAAANVRTSRRPVYDPGLDRKQDHGLGPASTAHPYSHSIFYVNADQTHAVRRGLGGEFYRERRNIGYWTWELDTFPDRWAGAFEPYHEIWTPSSFCRDAVALKAPKPVFRVPYAVAPETPAGMDRQHFGLAPDQFIFLYAFDVLSVPERKNPIAAVRAFQGAFPPGSRCQLVIKINHSETRPTYVEELRAACTSGAVRIFDSALSRSEMYALTRCADCILSLHRSEGFGLLIAEGMYFGKPAIATNYSGNTDFTKPDNSLLVDYHLIPVGRGCEPYDADSLWADPDIEQAARHISAIATDPDLRARLSAAGSEFVRSNLSAEAVGRQMRDRLEASVQASSFAGSGRPAAS